MKTLTKEEALTALDALSEQYCNVQSKLSKPELLGDIEFQNLLGQKHSIEKLIHKLNYH